MLSEQHISDQHNNGLTSSYDRDILFKHFFENPAICYLCRGYVNSSLSFEDQRSFTTTELVEYIVINNFCFPLDPFSNLANRHSDTVLYSKMETFIYRAANTKGLNFDRIDVTSIYHSMDTLIPEVVRNNVDVTARLFDFDLHVNNRTLYVDRAWIGDVFPEEHARINEMVLERIYTQATASIDILHNLFSFLYETFEDIFEDTVIEFNQRLLLIGMRTFLDVHRDFLDAISPQSCGPGESIFELYLSILEPILEEYSPFKPIDLTDTTK